LDRVFFRFYDQDEFSSVRRLVSQTEEHLHVVARRVIASTQRLEGATIGRSLFASSSIPMVLHQAAPTIERVETKETRLSEELRPWTQPASASISVDDVAEQVIRQIDQRTTAWRERLGKI
jgi:hypothetical protein